MNNNNNNDHYLDIINITFDDLYNNICINWYNKSRLD